MLAVEGILGLIVVAVVANLLLMAALIYPSFSGRARRKAGTRTRRPRRRRAGDRGGGRQRPHRRPERPRRPTRLRPGRPHRELGLPHGDRHDRRGDRAVARDPGGDPRAARPGRAVRHRRPRPAAGGRARPGPVRRRGLRRAHGRDVPGGADRWRPEPVLLHLPAHRRGRRPRGVVGGDGRADGRGGPRLPDRGPGGLAPGQHGPRGRGRDRDQPDGPDPARLRRDGHRPRAAPDARCGDPPLDHRPADGAVQPDVLLRGDRARDHPVRPFGPRVLPADDGPRRAQGDQRPVRPLPRRPRPARRRRGHRVRRPEARHGRPLRRRRVRRPPSRDRPDRRVRAGREDPARRPWHAARHAAGQPAAVAVGRRGQLPRRRPQRRRADDQRRRRDVRLQAGRQGPRDRRSRCPLERT